MAFILMTFVLMAFVLMAFVLMAFVLMAFVLMAFVLMAFVLMTFVLMAFVSDIHISLCNFATPRVLIDFFCISSIISCQDYCSHSLLTVLTEQNIDPIFTKH